MMTRKEMIKGLVGAMSISVPLATSLLGSPIKSMVGAKGVMSSIEGGKGFDNPYVTDGLIAMWDGEWNSGFGIHSSDINDFIDLATGERALVGYEYGWSTSIPEERAWTVEENGIRSNMCSANANVGVAVPFPTGYLRRYTVEFVRTIHSRTSLGIRSVIIGSYPNINYIGTIGILLWNDEGGLVAWYSGISISGLLEPLGLSTISYVDDSSVRKMIVQGSDMKTSYGGMFGVGNNTHISFASSGEDCTLHHFRIYNRDLTEEEMAKNAAIDKERFGL